LRVNLSGGVVLLVGLLPLTALAEEIVVRPEIDLGAAPALALSVAARPGDSLRVELPVRAGTGYGWSAEVAGEAVAAAGEPAAGGSPAGQVGGPAVQVFRYAATAPGRAELAFSYRRPWLPAEAAAGDVGIAVTVRP
jgi:inhibitor of cysteine peptidase